MTRILAAALLATLGGAACAQTDGPAEDACGASGLMGLVGQSGDVARLLSFDDRPLRVIPHGAPVTLDFRPDRLNLHLDTEDRIERIACG